MGATDKESGIGSNKSEIGSYSNPFMGLEIDKVKGEVRHQGKAYRFTSVFSVKKS
jgi:hypothetical protein